MKRVKFTEETGGREAWRTWRLGRSTGSKASKLFSRPKGAPVFNPADPKIGVYQLIAEGWIGSQALNEEEENPELAMARGTRLEPEAIERFAKETGKNAIWHNDDIGWESDEDSRIAFSPDASIGKTEAVEAKCLSAARHIQAFLTKEIPQEYEWQVLQAFVVNTSLRTLYFVFYDPRFPAGLDFFYIEIKRKGIKEQITALTASQKEMLAFVREKTNYLTQFVKTPPVEPVEEGIVIEEVEEVKSAYVYDPVKCNKSLHEIYKGIKERS